MKLMISVEMVGFFSDEKGSQKYPVPCMDKLYSDKANFIAIVANFGVENMLAVRKVKNSYKKLGRKRAEFKTNRAESTYLLSSHIP